MNFIPIKIPSITKRLFPNYVWDFSSKEKTIYLTFDDGPTPEITEWTLKTLAEFNAKATFFCIGNNIEKHPDIFTSILKEGHGIGNHTHNHLKGWKTPTNTYLKNVKQAQETIDSKIGNHFYPITNLFRPAYGQLKPNQGRALNKLGYKIVMWTVLAFDWDVNVSKEECLKNVIDKASAGSIIVFHDSVKASRNMMYALPKVLEHFSKKGYSFKSIEA